MRICNKHAMEKVSGKRVSILVQCDDDSDGNENDSVRGTEPENVENSA